MRLDFFICSPNGPISLRSSPMSSPPATTATHALLLFPLHALAASCSPLPRPSTRLLGSPLGPSSAPRSYRSTPGTASWPKAMWVFDDMLCRDTAVRNALLLASSTPRRSCSGKCRRGTWSRGPRWCLERPARGGGGGVPGDVGGGMGAAERADGEQPAACELTVLGPWSWG